MSSTSRGGVSGARWNDEHTAPLLKGLVSAISPELLEGLVAHRGFHSPLLEETRPLEGSLPAYAAAWSTGMSLCECDVRLTSDEELVLVHDDCLQKVAASPTSAAASAKVASTSLEELQRVPLRCGACVATLKEVLELALQLGGRLVVELKPGIGVGRAVARLLQTRPDLERAVEVVMSFELDSMLEYVGEQDRAPALALTARPLALLLTVAKLSGDEELLGREQVLDLDVEDADGWAAAVQSWRALGLDGVYAEWTPELTGKHATQLRRLSEACRAVGVWQHAGQRDDTREAQRLRALGARFVNTDLPLDFASARH